MKEKDLYNKIMVRVSKVIKNTLNESLAEQDDKFEELVNQIQYFGVDDPNNMYLEDIIEALIKFIKSYGYDCIRASFNEEEYVKDWFEENIDPNIINEYFPSLDDIEWHMVTYEDLEFYCLDSFDDDLSLFSFPVSFYGDWDNHIGVFVISI